LPTGPRPCGLQHDRGTTDQTAKETPA
jgi:hypothetical protein